jgi:nitroreductase
MDLAGLIRSRRSIGVFTTQPVPIELVQELLETAVYAPNHRMTEPWRFILVVDEGRERYAAIRRDMILDSMKSHGETERQQAAEGTYRKFMAIPMYLILAMKPHDDPETREEDYAACACVAQNFLLLAWDRGLGTSWKTFKNYSRLRAYLGLATDEKVVGVIHIGYPAETAQNSQRQSVNKRLTILNG